MTDTNELQSLGYGQIFIKDGVRYLLRHKWLNDGMPWQYDVMNVATGRIVIMQNCPIELPVNELDTLRAEVAKLTGQLTIANNIIIQEARDWAEAHDLLLAATGTVVDDAGQPPLIELVAKLTAERDALREELTRLKEAVWPGLPKFVSTPEKPQEDFYILVAEGLRAIFESHREPEGESNEQVQNSNSEPATQDAGKAD